MGGMWLPTMAGLARLIPIRVISDYVDETGTATNVEYTVPAGRMAILTTLAIEQTGGAAYTLIGYDFLIAGAGTVGRIVNAPPPGNFEPVNWEGWLWLQETDVLRSVVSVGDATSDYRSMVFGAEFDWVDVT